MGKGKRVREGRAAEKEALKIAAAKKAKKDRAVKITSIIVALVLFVSLLGGTIYHVVYTSAYSRGDVQRGTVVLESDNYTVDAAMMSYYVYSTYNGFVNQYSSMLSSLSLVTSKSIKSQKSPFGNDSTWFDYFCEQASSQVKEYIYLAEAGLKEGLKLDEKDQKSIQKIIDNYYAYAKEQKVSNEKFLGMAFGTGVKEGDVRKCLELSTLADKYFSEYQNGLEYSDKDIEKYYNDNVDSYRYVDYLSYSFAATSSSDKATYAVAKNKANELADVSSIEEFEDLVEKDVRTSAKITDDYTQKDLDEDVKEELETIKSEQVTFNKDDAASKWLFEKAKVGDTYVHDDEKGTYTVYYCTATPYRDETITRTIRNILLTENTYGKDEIEKKAGSLLAEMIKAGLTEETFNTYAMEYSEDTNTYNNGGLCENYQKSALGEEIAAWAYNKDRKEGDFEAVKMEGGYALCYYIGEGIPAWKATCISALKNADYSAKVEAWEKDVALTENEKGYKKIASNV